MAEVHAEAHQRLGDLRADADQDALAAQQLGRLHGAHEVAGDRGVYHRDAGDIHDHNLRAHTPDRLKQALHHLHGAPAVDHADQRQKEDILPDLDYRHGQLVEQRGLRIDDPQLFLDLYLEALNLLLALFDRRDIRDHAAQADDNPGLVSQRELTRPDRAEIAGGIGDTLLVLVRLAGGDHLVVDLPEDLVLLAWDKFRIAMADEPVAWLAQQLVECLVAGDEAMLQVLDEDGVGYRVDHQLEEFEGLPARGVHRTGRVW